MALSLTDAVYAKQRALADTRKPKIQALLKALFSYFSQHLPRKQLQFVAFSQLTSGSTVIADAACKLYAVYVTRPSTSTQSNFLKVTDDETTAQNAGNQNFTFEVCSGSRAELFLWPDGQPMAAGVTITADTSASTSSVESTTVSRLSGWVIVGAA
jgi:hypothetical protein